MLSAMAITLHKYLESVASVDEHAIALRERLATKRLEAEAAKDDLWLSSTKLSKLQEENKVINKEIKEASKELRYHETAKERLGAELRQLAELRIGLPCVMSLRGGSGGSGGGDGRGQCTGACQ
jgi:septal ring factor EnvC (AmiA/AmiB activator)